MKGDNGNAAAAPQEADPSIIPDDVRDKILAALKERVPQATSCVCCGTPGLSLATHYVTPSIVQPGKGMMIGGTIYPQIMLVCTKCGFTRYHNAVVLGVYSE